MDAAARSADKRSRDIAASQKRLQKEIEKGWQDVGNVIAAGIAGITIAGTFSKFVTESKNAQNEQAQLAAVLKSTGEAAGYTADQLNDMATAMAGKSIFDDGDINRAQTRLLSYTNVVGEQFPEALQAAIDMATRLGTTVEQASETVGKALDVPAEGLSALSKQGFRFTEAQEKLVASLQSTGRTAEAQKIILDAMKSAYGGAAEAARNTFGGAIAALQNQLNSLMTGSDGSLQGTASAINDLTRTLSSQEVKSAFDSLTTLLANTIAMLASATGHFVSFGKFVGESLAKAAGGSADPIERLDSKITGLTQDIKNLDAEIGRPRKFSSGGGYGDLDELKTRAQQARNELASVQKTRASLIRDANNPIPAPKITAPKLPKPGAIAVKGSGGAKDDDTKKLLENELKALERYISAEQELMGERNKFLELYNSQGLISIKDYYQAQGDIRDEATKNQIKAYDEEIAALRKYQASATKKTDKAEAEGKINELLEKQAKLQRETGSAALEAGIKQQLAADQYQDTLKELNARLLELQGNLGAAAAIRFDLQNDGLSKLFSAEGNTEAQDKLKRIRELTIAQADLNKLSGDYSLIQGQLQIAEDRIALAQKMGTQGELDGLVKLGEARRASYDQLKSIAEQYERIAKASGDPQMLLKADQLKLSLEQLSAELDPLANKFNTMFSTAASSAFGDFISGTKSAKDAFRSFIDDVFSQITKMVSQNLFQKLFGGMLGGDSGGGFNFGSLLSGLFGGARASGGPVEAGKLYRVNERGPELYNANGAQFLLPSASGTITPNHALRGGGGGGQTLNVFLQGKVERETPNQIAMEVRRRSNIAASRFA